MRTDREGTVSILFNSLNSEPCTQEEGLVVFHRYFCNADLISKGYCDRFLILASLCFNLRHFHWDAAVSFSHLIFTLFPL